MENLHLELDYPQSSIFRNILNTFKTINKNIFIHTKHNALHLHSIGPSRTSWLHVSLSRCFFNTFLRKDFSSTELIGSTGNPTLNLSDNNSLESLKFVCLPLKPIVKSLTKVSPFIVHSNGFNKKKPERFDPSQGLKIYKIILQNAPEDRTFKFQCIFKDFECNMDLTFAYQDYENEAVTTEPVNWSLRHSFGISPSTLLRIFDTHCSNTEFISLIVDVDRKVIRFQTPPSEAFGIMTNFENPYTLNNQNNLGEIELDTKKLKDATFDSGLPRQSTFTFSSQDFKAVTSLCEQMNLPIFLTFQTPGLPIILAFGSVWQFFLNQPKFSSSLIDSFWNTQDLEKRNDRNAWAGMLWSSTIPNTTDTSTYNNPHKEIDLPTPLQLDETLGGEHDINLENIGSVANLEISNEPISANILSSESHDCQISTFKNTEFPNSVSSVHAKLVISDGLEINNSTIKSKLQNFAYGDLSVSNSSSDDDMMEATDELLSMNIYEALLSSGDNTHSKSILDFWSQLD